MRMDSGFWSAKTIRACRRHRIRYSITVRQPKPIRAAIAAIDEQAWVEIVDPEGGLAQVAESRYQGDRLIVRRTRLIGAQAELFPTGATTPWSPTGSAPPCGWTKIIAATPSWSCAFATSRPASGCGPDPLRWSAWYESPDRPDGQEDSDEATPPHP